MSGLVLVVGALMLAAGGYEMFAGNGDILSERGWSAFIAGSVLVAGGVVTMAVGLALRAVDRLRGAIVGSLPAVGAASLAERLEPASSIVAPPSPIATQADLFHEPVFDQAPTAPVLASAPIEHALPHDPTPVAVIAQPPHAELEPQHETHHGTPQPAGAEPPREDWLDHSFAELEREMAEHPEPAEAPAPTHAEPVAMAAEHVPLAKTEAPVALVQEAPPTSVAHHAPPDETAPQEILLPEPHVIQAEPAAAEQATVSAREAPSESAVIGRYESEGTSYVMYADGSIDAQSAAGVYRFASMAELKTFIES